MRQDFCLDVHFTPTEMPSYMNVHDRYSYNELSNIFEQTDILVTPSIWYETFGYTVLEALSHGVPVILSDTVGAKDILANGVGIVIDNITPEKLCSVLQSLTKEELKAMNTTILEKQSIMTIDTMADEITEICYSKEYSD